ncbi:MAG: hypothetical protein V1721_10105 [Pseudomonadota bacterium]
MGGSGSGNWYRLDKKTYLDDCRCLDLNCMVKLGAIPQCGRRAGGWIWKDAETGERLTAISYEADTRDPCNAFLRIHYTFTESQKKIDCKVRLSRTEAHYGGGRWWFICPSTGKRVAKLYLPSGGDIFASRHAYRLAYESQSECPLGRAIRRKWSIAKKIGGQDWPRRPKGMHRTTFERLWGKAGRMEDIADRYFIQGARKILGMEL